METVKFEMDGALAVITLNMPPLNMVGEDLTKGLAVAMEKTEEARPRGLLLQAAGDNFSAGADVNMFSGLSSEQAGEMFSSFIDTIHMVESLPYPTMAAVQGICIAGGLEIALSMDLIWAADTALLGQSEAIIGAIPFGGGAQRLAARCGVARAKEIVFSGRFYPAAKFEQYNIVNRVVPAQDLQAKARKFMKGMAESGPTIAYKEVKEILNAYQSEGMGGADSLTITKSANMFNTEDLKAGVASLIAEGPGKAVFAGK